MDQGSLFGWAVIIATFAGPVAAVFVTRLIDARRDEEERRLSIFRTLMATRAVGISPERVGALNMIQIDFAKHPSVLNAWNELLRYYGTVPPTSDSELGAFQQQGRNLSTALLSRMASVIGIKIEQLDILDRVYYPEALVQLEREQTALRKFVVDIAEGRKALPVLTFPAAAPRIDP